MFQERDFVAKRKGFHGTDGPKILTDLRWFSQGRSYYGVASIALSRLACQKSYPETVINNNRMVAVKNREILRSIATVGADPSIKSLAYLFEGYYTNRKIDRMVAVNQVVRVTASKP